VNGIAGPGGVEMSFGRKRDLSLNRRSLRHRAPDYDGERVAVEHFWKMRIPSVHVRTRIWGQLLLVSDGRLAFSGQHRMDGLAPCFPAATGLAWSWWALADLSAARSFHLVVKFDAYAPNIFLQGGSIAASGGIAAMAMAIILSVWRAKKLTRHDVWVGALGR